MQGFVACLLAITFSFAHIWADEPPIPCITVEVPMRDGTTLPTDIYLPNAEAKGLPCVLIRAPNGRKSHYKSFAPLAIEGYAVAIQDTRSHVDSEGKTMPYLSDGWGALQDGYDTVQWLATSLYTNGKVGTAGISAQGITQLLLAPSCPPNLICQHIGVAAASIYDQGMFPGGQLLKHQVEGWLGQYAPHPSVLQMVTRQIFYNDFWAQFDTSSVASRVQVPGLHHGGWYDTFCQGTIDSFCSRQHKGADGARGQQKMVIGPWTHWWHQSVALGDYTIPEAGRQAPVDFSLKRWFDHYLKGIDNGIDRIPAITYYVMGPFDGSSSSGNVWRSTDQWPPASTATDFFLTPDRKLSTNLPASGRLSFRYDPSDPSPTLGGRNLLLKAGPVDQRPIEERSDILIFTTDVLEEDVEVTGRILAKMLFASDQPDTDIVVRLTDVYPDGRSVLIADGVRRLADVVPRYLSLGKAAGPRVVEVDLWSTSIVFAKGHRIRVSVASSNFPRYAKNLNGGKENEPPRIAMNTLYTGHKHGSRIILPIISREKTQ